MQENVELDKDLSRLLSLLSIYAFDTSSHVVLEYLIRRYKIHDMNADVLITSMIVAHDNKVSIIIELKLTRLNDLNILKFCRFLQELSSCVTQRIIAGHFSLEYSLVLHHYTQSSRKGHIKIL
jgi:hypothetical protein